MFNLKDCVYSCAAQANLLAKHIVFSRAGQVEVVLLGIFLPLPPTVEKSFYIDANVSLKWLL